MLDIGKYRKLVLTGVFCRPWVRRSGLERIHAFGLYYYISFEVLLDLTAKPKGWTQTVQRNHTTVPRPYGVAVVRVGTWVEPAVFSCHRDAEPISRELGSSRANGRDTRYETLSHRRTLRRLRMLRCDRWCVCVCMCVTLCV